MSTDDTEITWWLKTGCYVLGSISGIICCIGGIIGLLKIPLEIGHPLLILSDILMLILGFFLLLFEFTFVCKSVTFAAAFVDKVDSVKRWHKALIYGGFCIFIVMANFNLTQIAWVIPAFATATIYGFIALGKKGSVSDMMATARGVASTESNVNYENFGWQRGKIRLFWKFESGF